MENVNDHMKKVTSEEEVTFINRNNSLTCICCKSINPKYKCPNCSQKYCSVKCFKEHKENENCVILCKDKVERYEDINQVSKSSTPHKNNALILMDEKKIKKAERNKKAYRRLVFILKNKRLQNEVETIVNCRRKGAHRVFNRLMKDPLFFEYVHLIETIRGKRETDDFNYNN